MTVYVSELPALIDKAMDRSWVIYEKKAELNELDTQASRNISFNLREQS